MKYPYIGKSTVSGRVVLFASPSTGVVVSGSYLALGIGKLETSIDETYFKNITHEYLSNTWGVVESKEHAEFIVGLAESHGFESIKNGASNKNYFHIGEKSFALLINKPTFIGGCKQITIPLPPKAEEWPKVGDEVVTSVGEGVVKLLGDKLGHYLVDIGGVYNTFKVEALKKPKTPEEELRDDLISEINSAPNGDYAVDVILEKYNITKKDKGDE